MPGFTFPSVGPLGLSSPPSRPSTSDHRYYDPLRLPLLHLGSLRISLDPRYLALSRLRSSPLRLALQVQKITRRRLASFIFRFAYPGILRKEMAVLSSSQATPVCACPARRPRWCPLNSPWRLKDQCFPSNPKRQLSPACAGLSFRTTTIQTIFEAQSRGLRTRYTWLHTHPLGYACRFTTVSAANLLWWELGSCLSSPTG